MTTRGLILSYRAAFVTVLLVASLLTLIGPEHDAAELAIAEIAGALLFLWRLSQYVGAAILLCVFMFAEYLSLNRGHLSTYFLQYALTVTFLVAMDRRV